MFEGKRKQAIRIVDIWLKILKRVEVLIALKEKKM
jgi:hypothetical protein